MTNHRFSTPGSRGGRLRPARPALRAALLASLLTCLCAGVRAADFVEGEVVAVTDGDTITVLDRDRRQHRVRLNGIDAPETGQAFGERSKQHLSGLVFGKRVSVWVPKLDRYGRLLGKVSVGGTDVNLEQLKAGMAWYYRQYERDIFRDDRAPYDRAEREARAARRGLWADPDPTPPWEFRRGGAAGGRREAGTTKDSPGEAGDQPARPAAGGVIGNRRSRIYQRPDCPNYADVSPRNRVHFGSEAEAERAGYRPAKNCPD